MMKSKKENASNEYRIRNEHNVLLSENKKLKNVKNNFNNNNKQMLEQYKIKLDETNKEKDNLLKPKNSLINPLAQPSAGAPALKYGDVNTETTSPVQVKGLINVMLQKENQKN